MNRRKNMIVPNNSFTEFMLYTAPDGMYKKYGLCREEIDFIESMIRPMDLSQNGGAND